LHLHFQSPRATINATKYHLFAGGLLGVEKVKPDPLNLLANTSVGSRSFELLFVPLLDISGGILMTFQILRRFEA